MQIGKLQLHQPITLAPMEDVSDIPFRMICKRFGADIVYTEFTSSEAIIRDTPRAMRKIEICDEERPVGIQIFGGVESSMADAAKIAEENNPDILDVNCGCWVKNHVSKGEGAALLKNLPHFERIVKATVKATKLPVTIKTRLGWDHNSIIILDVAKMVEQSGAAALTLHCRTRSQAHNGLADWNWLEKVKKAINIPLIGNGDLTTPEDIRAMFETGCDGVMIGRAAIGNPWIFKRAKHFMQTGVLLPEPTVEERVKVCIEHLRMAVNYKGQRDGVITFRKYYAGYLRGIPNIAQLRGDIMTMIDIESVIKRLYQFLDESPQLSPLNS